MIGAEEWVGYFHLSTCTKRLEFKEISCSQLSRAANSKGSYSDH